MSLQVLSLLLLSIYAQEASGFLHFGVSRKILHVSLVSLVYVFIIHSFITRTVVFVTYKCKVSRHAII